MALTTHSPRHVSDTLLAGKVAATSYYTAQAAAVALAAATSIDLRGKTTLYVEILETQAGTMNGIVDMHFAIADATADYQTEPAKRHLVRSTAVSGNQTFLYTFNLKDIGAHYCRIPISTVIANGTVTVNYAFG